jgi:uridine kinase
LTHAIDFELLVTQLKELKAGNIIHQPVYCTLTQDTVTTHPRKVMMIIEGILILANPELRDLFDVKILYMQTLMKD